MAKTGRVVYNAAGVTPGGALLHLPDMLDVIDRIGMKTGTVIFEYTERRPLPTIGGMAARAFAPQTTQPRTPRLTLGERLKSRWSDFQVSRLQILSSRFDAALHDRPALDRVALRHLSNGDPILFIDEEVRQAFQTRAVNVDFFTELQRELRKRDFDLLVVLVPNKYTVYSPLIRESELFPNALPPYVDRIDEALRNAGVAVLNLRPTYAAEARAALENNRLIYWKDDTHWNPAGIDLAASLIAESLKPSAGSGSSSPRP
jgi:hypothetical protein